MAHWAQLTGHQSLLHNLAAGVQAHLLGHFFGSFIAILFRFDPGLLGEPVSHEVHEGDIEIA